VERVSVVAGLARVWIGTVLEQQTNGAGVTFFRCRMQTGPAWRPGSFDVSQIPVTGEHDAHDLDIGAGARLEESRDGVLLTIVDGGLELTPAGEAVIPRHGKERCGELRAGIRLTQRAQPIFRKLSEEFE
jgi:hypothetical protein